jgi:hypothetical protein
MATQRSKGESEPMTLGQALAAHVRLIVWCKSLNHRAEPDVAVQVNQHGAGVTGRVCCAVPNAVRGTPIMWSVARNAD